MEQTHPEPGTRNPNTIRPMRTPILLVLMFALPVTAQTRLDQLKQGQTLHNFRVQALYLNDADQPLGARFTHVPSGFTLDYLQIESVPQGYTWVNSFPVGDQGEPHTQEHLLLGKGTTGRAFAGLDTMWLSTSTAFTQQWRTSYHFNTGAGTDVFFDLFAAELNALLHPNYSDEEIRREVRHFGVTTAADGTLRLEEKGSVYNEMTSSSANRYRVLFRTAGHLTYGTQHPLSYNAGGEPSGIRTMKPEDIRNFHAATHYLANMGSMVAFPKSTPLADVLRRTDAILKKVEPEPSKRPATTATPLPPPQSAAPGTIAIGEYPHRNDQQPSPISFVWPPVRTLSPEELILLNLFADAFAGDATTNVYKLFVDSTTKVMDTGATGVFNQVSSDLGHPVSIVLDNVAASNLTAEKLAEIRSKLTAEIERIASLEDGSAELKEFNARVLSRVIETERELANFVNTPPGWGGRGTGSGWLDQLTLLDKVLGFRKSVTLKPQLASIRKQLAADRNIWREHLRKWQIAGATPFVAAAKPSPSLLQREDAERLARAETEAQRIAREYGMEDVQQALKRYQEEYDAESARIEAEASAIPRPQFVKNPPMTLDDQLQYSSSTLKSNVTLVTSTFENMSSATLGLALRADVLPREQLRYLSLLPALLTRVGVMENGKPVSFDEMSERLRKEILNLNAAFSTNPRTERVELVVRGAGLGLDESRRAIDWMNLVLHHPDWRVENLPRIRDLVDQSLSTLRNTMQGSEESWVNNPSTGYRMQHNPAFLAADSFLTRTHNALRLRWLLKEAAEGDRAALTSWFDGLAGSAKGKSRAEMKTMLGAGAPESLSAPARVIAAEALKDLDLTLIEIPDRSLEADFAYLVRAMREDLFTPPAATLEALHQVRRALLQRSNARMSLVGSTATQKALAPKIETLSASLGEKAVQRASYGSVRHVDQRLNGREAGERPEYVGLLAPNMKGGVIITSVPSVHFSDHDDREKQLDYLASRLHAGYGAHGVFLKTLAAGLAYSNGLRGNVQSGQIGYYAERTPEIPQTVGFVVDILKNAERDPGLADYVVAIAFGESRAALTYEARAEGIAADLADNQPPDQVRRFRQSILELRKDPELGNRLFDRKDAVYGRMLPGYDRGGSVEGAVYYTIGAENQLDAWERYLTSREGEESQLRRLYPRDYWMP
jgi:Zn-dependent M16 (insulinase) family peptidase